MSDFFMSNTDDYWKNKSEEAKANQYTTQINQNTDTLSKNTEAYKQKKEQHYENWNRYGVDVPDEYYDVFNNIIGKAENPEQAQEEAYRIGSAIKYSQMMDIPLDEAYKNVDAYNEANFTDIQGQKGRFEALSDMFSLGTNNVKLGRLGQELMQAHRNNDEELANSIMAQIDAINQQNVLMQDNTPRSWVMQALEAGAQSLPFTGVVAGAGIIGNFIAPAAGTAAAFAASSYLASGQEYIDMLANGATPQTAAAVALVSGGIQGLIEADLGITKGIVKGTARVIGKEAAENAAKKSLEEIGRKVFKRFHFGAGKKVLVNYLENYGKNILGEGTEEFLQEITSIVGQEVAASLDGYDIPDDDFKSIVKQTTEAFRGGVLGALSMGFIPAGINGAADIKEYKLLKEDAEAFESPEMFKDAVKDSPVFEGMSDEAKSDVINEVWKRAQDRKEQEANAEAKKIAEVQDAAEGSEELKTGDDENEEAEPTEVVRDEQGQLYTQDDVATDNDGNVTGGTFVAGNRNEETGNRYGYIKWEYADKDQSKIIINDFKMAKGREGIRAEVYNDFAIQHPGVDIQWNTKGSEAAAVKELLAENNPAGKKNGLNYYADENAVADASTRAWVSKQLDDHIYNIEVVNNQYKKTKLTNTQKAAGVALLEAAAKRTGMSLNEYVNKTFGNEIFGDTEVLQKAALRQAEQDIKEGKQVTAKAGGVDVGIAQQGWKQFGQQVKAVIYAGEHADFSTWTHELAHIFQNQLDGKLKEEAEAAFNVIDGDWINSKYTFKDGHVDSAAEAFAYGFQDWLKTGKAESEQMKNIFQKFAEFIARAYNSLKDFINLSPEITSVYEQLLSGDDSLLKAAEMAVEAEDRRYRAQMQQQAQEAETKKQTEAEQKKKSEEAEREEASELTDFTEEEKALTPEQAEENVQEAANETEKTNNAIDNALENTDLTDDQKTQIADVLKDETTTVEEKAEAATDAASSAYIPYDLFQTEAGIRMQYQLAGEKSIQRMVEGEEKKRISLNLETAKQMEKDGEDAATIRKATGWEKHKVRGWQYETDDSLSKITIQDSLEKALKTDSDTVVYASQHSKWLLKNVLKADELFEIFPYLKNIRLKFYDSQDFHVSRIDDEGICLNVNKDILRLTGGPGNFKKSLVHEIQHLIQALEYARTKEDFGLNIADHIVDAQIFYNQMLKAAQDMDDGKGYDKASVDNHIQEFMLRRGEVEARIVASRVLLDANQRKAKTLVESEAEVEEEIRKENEAKGKGLTVRFQKVTDPELLEKLNSEPTIKVYRAMQVIDGKYYPPMATVVDGKRVDAAKPGEWIQADENPELAIPDIDPKTKQQKVDKDGNLKWKFVLDKGGKDSSGKALTKIPAAYNPYWHTSRSPLNDQFSSAYKRPNIVTVEVEVPESELTSGYKAERAKDTVGEMDWHSGPVSSKLAEAGNPRKVILSRYCKIVRVIPDAEVAQTIKEMLDGTDIAIPDNTITPSLKNELEKIGVKVEETEDVKNYNQQVADMEEATKKAKQLLFMNELTMYGIHNLSEEALRHAVKMGGLANPSMAVVDTEKNSFTNFGDISLIPYNFMLEKGEGSKGTFGADIYSPRYPSIDKTVTETGQKKVHAIFHAIEDEQYKNELEQKLINKIENSSKQFDYAYSPLVMAYLAEKGNKDFYKYEKSEYSDEVKDLIKSLGASPNAMAAEDNKVILEAYSKHLRKDYEAQIKAKQEDLEAHPEYSIFNKNVRLKNIEKLQEDLDIANETIKELVDEKTGLFNGNVADDFLYRVRHEIESAGKIDYSASEYAARELIENDPEFLPWAKEAYDRIEKEERIFNGFTPSGNRRYLAHTLENVSKYMRQQELQGGESFYYGLGSTRAKFTPNFKTLNQIKKARDRLVTSEEFEKIKEEYNERFDKITEALGDKYDPDVGAARFEEAFEYGKSDPIGYIEKEYGISVDDNMAQEILDFATALRVMPTEYFETKYTRPVQLNEFAGAIIPSNLSQDLKNTLAEKGLMIEEYDREAGNREEVTKAALQKFNETRRVLFQEVYHGSGADFDKFDIENYGLSGEGSMSFGYGTYVTDSEDIARDYAERNANTYPVMNYDEMEEYSIAKYIGKYKTLAEARKIFNKEYEKIKESLGGAEPFYTEEYWFNGYINSDYITEEDYAAKRNDAYKPNKHLYTVEIPDDGYLEWNEEIPLQDVIKIVNRFINYTAANSFDLNVKKLELPQEWSYDGEITGRDLYARLDMALYGANTNKIVSRFLNSIGYAGIKYPAGTIHGNGNGAYNYVIFNDDDAKIVDHLFYQTEAELQDEALSFDNWQDFMEYCEAMHSDDEVSPIPYNADAQWYQSFYETAHGIQTEAEKNEEQVTEQVKKEGALPAAVDALFTTYLKSDPQMIDSFLKAVADIDAIDLDSEEWQHVEDAEGAKQRERYDQLKDFIDVTLSDYNWQTAIKRIQGGHEIAEGLRKRLLGEMTDSYKVRDFRALYAEVMDDQQFAVDEADSTIAQLNKKLSKYKKFDILRPNEDISRVSPERRKRIAEALQNKEIAEKIRNGSLKLDDEIEAYLKSLDKQVKDLQKDYNELEKETKNDYQRLADAERRKLMKLHEELLLARSKLKSRDAETERKIKKGLKITEKYHKVSQNLTANYDELFRKFTDLKNTMQITAEVQAALDRQEQVAGLKENLNNKQKEKNLIAEVKKMRIQLVKRTMRRVPFNRIDYENARTVIAIQRMLEPNLLGGVNRFIGIDSAYLRGVISGIVTDTEYKEKILNYLRKQDKSSQAFVNFLKKVEDLKTIKDFDSWTAKERKYAIKHLPKENWIRDLNLLQLAKEREESIDLDIGMKEKQIPRIDPKTGEPMHDKEGNIIYETSFVLDANDELKKLVRDAVGADMYDLIVDKPFAEWTTEELERLAQRIDELYTEGRDLYAAKLEARKRENDSIRKRVEDAIKETGITINDDDTPEEKERKAKKIAAILNQKTGLKGTEAGKNSGIKAKFDRLINGYADANVLRVSRILDNQSEGENVRLLYRREDECYNNKTRSIMRRGETVKKVMADNKITEGNLAESIKVSQLGTEFTVDELLYFLAADKDYEIDERKVKPDAGPLDMNDDYAATSRNAVMFGNMMSDNASQEQKEAWLQLDKDMQDAIENDRLTQEQKEALAIGQLDKKPGTTRFIKECHARWEIALGAANNFLANHPEYNALLEAIEADYAEQYERMNEISINEFNTPVHRVRAYVPLVRRESNGDTNVNQVKEDLLGAYGGDAGKQWVNKGMTQRRVNIGPLNQKPVQTGLFRTWADSIERTEHFIAYAPYVRQLNAVYKSRDASYTRRFIEARYGKPMLEYIDNYINEVANPNANKVRERGSEFLHILRGKTAPAYLGWKFSGIVKQGLTSPWPYMQFVNPAEYLAAATKCWTTGGKYYDAIKEKSAYMASRVMDPINELVDEMADNAKGKVDRAWSNFAKKGMAGLEWIDWTCVAPGWLACYQKEYNRLQNMSEARYQEKIEELTERNMTAEIGTSEWMSREQIEAAAKQELMDDIETEAVRYADDCTRACQPSSRLTDLAPLFKNSSEAMKAFLQFQTSLNVIWQNIRYDIPYNIRQKEFKKIVGTVCGYVLAGIFMNSVMDGIGGDDDDEDTQALRNLIFYSTTQFTDAIPMIGSDITNMMDQVITGKRGFAQSGTDMTPSATKLMSALQKATSGDFKKAASLTAEGIGLGLGAPVSGTKEIYKLLGKPLSEGDINLKRGVSDVYGIAGDILEE